MFASTQSLLLQALPNLGPCTPDPGWSFESGESPKWERWWWWWLWFSHWVTSDSCDLMDYSPPGSSGFKPKSLLHCSWILYHWASRESQSGRERDLKIKERWLDFLWGEMALILISLLSSMEKTRDQRGKLHIHVLPPSSLQLFCQYKGFQPFRSQFLLPGV